MVASNSTIVQSSCWLDTGGAKLSVFDNRLSCFRLCSDSDLLKDDKMAITPVVADADVGVELGVGLQYLQV